MASTQSNGQVAKTAVGGRTAIVGTGHRGQLYLHGVVDRSHIPGNLVVALCDTNPGRMGFYNKLLKELGQPPATEYPIEKFEEMLEKEKVQVLVVTTVDATHHEYIIPALKRGIRVVTEKPMTTTIESCRAILQTVKETNNHVTVTFNYRYNPAHEKIKNLIPEIGKVVSVHFEWLLDTAHGADYFRRWHRFKTHSGGLMVHKSGHHFDLVNWWLASTPKEVFAMGSTAFYGDKAGGKESGWAKEYDRALGSEEAKKDPFAIQLEANDTLKQLYVENEKFDGYERDRNVFGKDIQIEDDMGCLVRYKNGAVMTYHLTAYSPWEGYRVMFNGTKGRLELEVVESAYRMHEQVTAGPGSVHGTVALPNAGEPRISLHPLWQPPVNVKVDGYDHAGHGGGDKRLLSTIFGKLPGQKEDTNPASQMASTEMDGAWALAVGLAANESFETGKLVDCEKMLGL